MHTRAGHNVIIKEIISVNIKMSSSKKIFIYIFFFKNIITLAVTFHDLWTELKCEKSAFRPRLHQ